MTPDLVGQRFGRLVVTEKSESYSRGRHRWACTCDCGKTKVILGGSLLRGTTRSCGCLHNEQARINRLRSPLTRWIEHGGERICAAEFNRKYGGIISDSSFVQRLKKGWDPMLAAMTPRRDPQLRKEITQQAA